MAPGEPLRSVLSVGISNERLWKQGLYYRGIHIGAKDHAVTSEYDWWSYGRAEIRGGTSIDTAAAPIHNSTSPATSTFVARGLLHATLRSVKEPVLPILIEDLERADPEAQSRFREYIATCRRRTAQKYGRASDQYYLICLMANPGFSREAARRAVSRRQWAPSWETMMRLDQDKQRLDPLEP